VTCYDVSVISVETIRLIINRLKGCVDKHQMETIMAHELTPEGAADVIVKGMQACL
jgi:hypothetical protein